MRRRELGKSLDISNFEVLTDKLEEICQSAEDRYFCNNLLDWIEMIENVNLYKAVKSLSEEEQTLLSYLYFKVKTQKEVGKIYGVTYQGINKKLHDIFKKIKEFFV